MALLPVILIPKRLYYDFPARFTKLYRNEYRMTKSVILICRPSSGHRHRSQSL